MTTHLTQHAFSPYRSVEQSGQSCRVFLFLSLIVALVGMTAYFMGVAASFPPCTRQTLHSDSSTVVPTETPVATSTASPLPAVCNLTPPHQLDRMRYALDCELTALWYSIQMSPKYRGIIAKDDLYANLPFHENPNKGFRGEIQGPRNGDGDQNYGLHAPALVILGRQLELPLRLFVGKAELQAHICQGEPVLVWVRNSEGRQYSPKIRIYEDSEGDSYQTVGYEHVLLIVGYDAEHLQYLNPLTSNIGSLSWQVFEQEQQLFKQKMIALSP